MATSLPTDMKFFDPLIQTGYSEKIAQMTNAFNAASRGTIVMRSNRKIGDYDYQAFFKNAGGLVSRQDQTSLAAATEIALTQENIVSVKLNRKIGPVSWARSAVLKPGLSMDAFKIAAGEQAASDALADTLNSSLGACRAALNNQAANKFTVAANGTMTTSALVSGLSKLGDRSNRVSAWVMHSKVLFDLMNYQVSPTNNGDLIANMIAMDGVTATLGRPIIVTDSSALVVVTGSGSAAVTDYMTLGLTENGIVAEDTEEEYMTMEEVTGLEQIKLRLQGEYAFNVGVKGFQWDVANGGKNPSSAALATGTNWEKVFASGKDLAGVIIQSR